MIINKEVYVQTKEEIAKKNFKPKTKEVCMKASVTKSFVFFVILIGLLMQNGCNFEEIDQPETATAGEEITVSLTLSTSDEDANPKWGILGMMLPTDWIVNSVTYDGDFGQGTCHFLHPDSADKYPSAQDYWTDSLEFYFPTAANMQWVVYESDSSFIWTEISYIDVTIDMTVGMANGDYNLGYFFTEGAWDFTSSSYYTDSLGNAITVTGGNAVDDEVPMVNGFKLSQNFPNPFNPTTNIQFEIPENSFVTLSVFDMMGHEVAKLVDDYRGAGSYNVTLDGSNLASGIYFYKLQTDKFSQTMKMVLSK